MINFLRRRCPASKHCLTLVLPLSPWSQLPFCQQLRLLLIPVVSRLLLLNYFQSIPPQKGKKEKEKTLSPSTTNYHPRHFDQINLQVLLVPKAREASELHTCLPTASSKGLAWGQGWLQQKRSSPKRGSETGSVSNPNHISMPSRENAPLRYACATGSHSK